MRRATTASCSRKLGGRAETVAMSASPGLVATGGLGFMQMIVKASLLWVQVDGTVGLLGRQGDTHPLPGKHTACLAMPRNASKPPIATTHLRARACSNDLPCRLGTFAPDGPLPFNPLRGCPGCYLSSCPSYPLALAAQSASCTRVRFSSPNGL